MNWEEWIEQIDQLFDVAIESVDEDYIKQNLKSQAIETRMLLEIHKLLKPREYTLVFDDKTGGTNG